MVSTLNRTDPAGFFENQIKIERGNMRISCGVFMALLIAGVVLTLSCLYFASSLDIIFKIGPMIMSVLVGTMPMKRFLTYRSRMAALTFFLGCCSNPDPQIQEAITHAMTASLRIEGKK